MGGSGCPVSSSGGSLPHDTMIYLGGNEPETHKYMTEMLGKYTLGKRSSSESLGSKGSASSNFDVVG